ncbi:MAG: DegT/DnrJ/EryC1/StrS family aminotransferase [Acidobacteria bacterium]|nr:DegT/DnrJ/EryC1/StrS family aminotransferase [Acidobacteriota bacterium]
MIKPFAEPIYVTRPFLPAFDKFCDGLKEIWETRWLTNKGTILQRYTKKLADYLGSENICLFANGTLALQIGLQGMEISGEVITTPFTFVATTHALYWNKIRPIFVDIEPEYYTLDPEKVEAAVTPKTAAILAVHIYGHPCRLNELAAIAQKHNIKLIYDAAHAFGVKVGGTPVSRFGDLSMFSFHATKLYHSIEGGMLSFRDGGYRETFDYLKNFGFKNEVEVVMPGTNAKMNEFQALMGEMVLTSIDEIIAKYEILYKRYVAALKDVPGIKLVPGFPENTQYNFAYMPVEIDAYEFGMDRDSLYEELKKYNVFTRRYFYPLLTDLACYRSIAVEDPLTVARKVSSSILALPIYEELTIEEVDRIAEMIRALPKNRHS